LNRDAKASAAVAQNQKTFPAGIPLRMEQIGPVKFKNEGSPANCLDSQSLSQSGKLQPLTDCRDRPKYLREDVL